MRHDLSRRGSSLPRGRSHMPFPLIPTALGVSFFLVWLFIGGMIVHDSQLTVRRERDR